MLYFQKFVQKILKEIMCIFLLKIRIARFYKLYGRRFTYLCLNFLLESSLKIFQKVRMKSLLCQKSTKVTSHNGGSSRLESTFLTRILACKISSNVCICLQSYSPSSNSIPAFFYLRSWSNNLTELT